MAMAVPATVLAAAVFAAFVICVVLVVVTPEIGIDLELALQVSGDHVGDLARRSADDLNPDFAVANRVPTGIEAVYVNGRPAYSPDPEFKTVRSGKVLRIK